MKKISFAVLILLFLICGCSGNNDSREKSKQMNYDFKEPVTFPFEVNAIHTEIAIDNPDVLQQFIFHYKNIQTTQELKYILSKVIDQPEKVSEVNKQTVHLENGKQAFYEVGESSQSIWWESENGFLARFVYYINGNKNQLGDLKIDVSELIKLANQVQ
ncbi:hypothetical protein ASG89_19000 [Paenibacillus sp. Soil766]|uniref:hypothetical protein n=1 Tax=Paenibacillus sp. Soil766 TaxID=1736404 RepID=UPI000708A13E|nr:hypothetical protein [Paenibacillus sp. Soil766]KRF06545.1 hypothetical protein ASG89_19000 [Paenibacillus sp. Soil766]